MIELAPKTKFTHDLIAIPKHFTYTDRVVPQPKVVLELLLF